jgi:hypothetical protein
MSAKDPLALPIEGYRIALLKESSPDAEFTTRIADFQLKLSKVGGAHITNAESLITMIEDAVFKEEQINAEHSS